ncbi:hypothetical protein Tco_0522503 [Tanacetum coccineum]
MKPKSSGALMPKRGLNTANSTKGVSTANTKLVLPAQILASTNSINNATLELVLATSKVNTASAETSTASFSDATAYAFLSSQPQGSQLVHEDLEQIHDDDLEEMDLKWNMHC